MANTIKIKQSSVATKVPLAEDLDQGELAINTIDEKLYTKNSSGVVVQLNVDTDTVYSHPTGNGNKHIPSNGSAGQFLKYTSAGTAVWAADNNTDTTYTNVSEFTNDVGYITSYVDTNTTYTGGTNVSISAGNVISSTDTNTETTTTLSVNANTLTYTDEVGGTTDIDLSLYIDDTNLARLTSGTLNGTTGVATFTRDDSTTFTLDLSGLLDTDTNTWRGIQDNLTSTSTTDSLSANQGKWLKDNVVLTSHILPYLSDTGGTLYGNLNLGDNDKVQFGDDADLDIYHDSATNTNYIESDRMLRIGSKTGGELITLAAAGDAEVGLWHGMGTDQASLKLYTQPGGVAINGVLKVDSIEALSPGGTGLTYTQQDGTVTEILDNNAKMSYSRLKSLPSTFQAILGIGATDALAGNTPLLGIGTTSTTAAAGDHTHNGLNLGDGEKAQFGAGNDLQIYHDAAGHSYINESGIGHLYVQATNIRLKSTDGENFLVANREGSVDLYYDNIKKLATTSTGINVTGTVAATSYTGDGSALTGITGGVNLTSATTAPSSPTAGDQWFDTTNGILYAYMTDGTQTQWLDISSANGQAAGGGGAMELVSSTTLTSSVTSVEFTGLSGYDRYIIKYSNWTQFANASMYLNLGEAGSYLTAYTTNVKFLEGTSTSFPTHGYAEYEPTRIKLGDTESSGTIEISNCLSSSYKHITFSSVTTKYVKRWWRGYSVTDNSTAPLTSIKIFPEFADVYAGTIVSLYGIKDS